MMRTHRGGLMAWLDRHEAARLLDAELPEQATDVRYVVWHPSGDLAYREALVRFELAAEPYQAWLDRAGFAQLAPGESPLEGRAAWLAPPEVPRPEWWTPTDATPRGTARRRVGDYGSLLLKWENGAVFAHLVDTGHRAAGG
jgi:hypothetical protein